MREPDSFAYGAERVGAVRNGVIDALRGDGLLSDLTVEPDTLAIAHSAALAKSRRRAVGLGFTSHGTEMGTGDVIGSDIFGTGCILELSRVHGSDKYPWLEPGDHIRLAIEELGNIETTLKPGPSAIPL